MRYNYLVIQGKSSKGLNGVIYCFWQRSIYYRMRKVKVFDSVHFSGKKI